MDDREDQIIVSRRPTGPNEFIYSYSTPIQSAKDMLAYIDRNCPGVKIEKIEHGELPMGQGYIGWRVLLHKENN